MAVTTVRELMTDVVETLAVGDTLARASDLMKAGKIRHLPVVDANERVVGLVTHRRVVSAWVSLGDPNRERQEEVAQQIPVDMIMEKEPLTVAPDMPAAEAARLLEVHKYGGMPVVEEGKLIGIITEADFVRFARRYFEHESLEV